MLHTLHALHGFLGKPSDWDFLNADFNVHAHEIAANNTLWQWAAEFNQKIRSKEKKILLGYSLGGRLALHALLDNPQQWSGAIIVSAHPGFTTDEERTKRFQQDMEWAKRFAHEPWERLMQEWNANPIFNKTKPPFTRYETDYVRENLCNILQNWSLGKQENLQPHLSKVSIPILWIAGENDTRYASLAKTLNMAHPKSQRWIASNAAHRVPWECPEKFSNVINSFLEANENGYISMDTNP